MGRHVVFWLFLYGVLLFFACGFMSSQSAARVVASDIHVARGTVGDEPVNTAIRFANGISQRLVTDMRLNQSSGNTMEYADSVYRHVSYNLLALAYLALFRLRLLVYWLFPSLVVLIAATADASSTRAIKLSSFGYCSPVIYAAASHGVIAAVAASILYLLVPIPLPPIVPMIGLAVTAWALHQAIANYQPLN